MQLLLVPIESTGDPYRWIAGILTNITRIVAGGELLLDHKNCHLLKMLSMLDHRDMIRRGGAVTTIRNCLFLKHHNGVCH